MKKTLKLTRLISFLSLFLTLIGSAIPNANASANASANAQSSASAPALAGRDYSLVSPAQSTNTPSGKIEVIEFFWYGCPHCYHLEPTLKQWVKKLPKDVSFRRVPAVLSDRWVVMTQLFYTLEALNELDRLHGEVFDAIHKNSTNLENEKIRLAWIEQKGINRKKFTDTWSSFTLQSKVKRAMQLTEAYKLTGVPAVVVEGKYLTSPSMTGTSPRFLSVLNELIEKARREAKKH